MCVIWPFLTAKLAGTVFFFFNLGTEPIPRNQDLGCQVSQNRRLFYFTQVMIHSKSLTFESLFQWKIPYSPNPKKYIPFYFPK